MRTIKLCLLVFCLSCLVGCSQVNVTNPWSGDRSLLPRTSQLAETTTPRVIQELNKQLDQYNPQVKILAPRSNQIVNQTDIEIQLAVEDLPIFQDDKLKLGNHLTLILDNEPAQQIYDVTEGISLKDLTPGTHTLRVFADRPWGESYKNQGAYAQATFSVLTETNNNRPNSNLPLLTYNNPIGTYGAEPILLDFYLTNAPLHTVAQNDPNLSDWQIKATVNGESFFLENWQPVYLKGLNKGNNWIQLALIDKAGNDIENVYNNTVRVINYDPQYTDTLSQLMTDKIALADAQPLIEQNYYIQPVGEPEIIEPTLEIEKEEKEEKLEEEISVEDNSENQNISNPESENIELNIEPEPETVNEPEVTESVNSTESKIDPTKETAAIEKTRETTQDVEVKDTANISSKPEISSSIENKTDKEVQETVTLPVPNSSDEIPQKNLDSDSTTPIPEGEISQPESVEITEDEIDEIEITTPSLENREITENPLTITEKVSTWWKQLLISLRQKLENLVKLLPKEA